MLKHSVKFLKFHSSYQNHETAREGIAKTFNNYFGVATAMESLQGLKVPSRVTSLQENVEPFFKGLIDIHSMNFREAKSDEAAPNSEVM